MAELTVTYLVLAHESTARVIRLVDRLLAEDPTGLVTIHFDKSSGEAPYQRLSDYYTLVERCQVLPNRVCCGWGQWSLVEATLRMLRWSLQNRKTDYYYLLSEFCYPTQPLSALKEHLKKNFGTNFIESHDSSWIKAGIREDRYLYRHFLNKRKYPRLHRWTYKLQKWLGLKRKVPSGLTIRFGSQWWCLTNNAVEAITRKEPEFRSFFKLAWVPDELFFQTMLSKLEGIRYSEGLTYYKFDLHGSPLFFECCNVIDNRYFFLRKFSGESDV